MSADFRDHTLRDLESYVARLEAHFYARSDNKDPQFRAFLQMTKLGEEFGETCEAAIRLFGKQRADKEAGHDPRESLEDEMADVVLATFNLAARLGLSVTEGLRRKTAVVAQRTGVVPMGEATKIPG